jgi:hypothetical protein
VYLCSSHLHIFGECNRAIDARILTTDNLRHNMPERSKGTSVSVLPPPNLVPQEKERIFVRFVNLKDARTLFCRDCE